MAGGGGGAEAGEGPNFVCVCSAVVFISTKIWYKLILPFNCLTKLTIITEK